MLPIIIKAVSSNPHHGEVYSIQHYVIKLSVTCGRPVVFSRYSGFPDLLNDRLDINEILLKVALHTIILTLTLTQIYSAYHFIDHRCDMIT